MRRRSSELSNFVVTWIAGSSASVALCLVASVAAAHEPTTTWGGIQTTIFNSPVYKCTECHNTSDPAGGLDLTAGRAYSELVSVPARATGGILKRVDPGRPSHSLLYLKLLLATDCSRVPALLPDNLALANLGSPMPSGVVPPVPCVSGPEPAGAVTRSHLEAIHRWIAATAPEEGVVDGTGVLLDTETPLPPAAPVTIEIPATPAEEGRIGIQLRQPPYELPANSERELCMGTYYDVTSRLDLVPERARVDCPSWLHWQGAEPGCFFFDRTRLAQDPLSHHAIIYADPGDAGPAQEFPLDKIGPFQRHSQETGRPGAACDPQQIDPALGFNPDCAGKVVNGPGCIYYPRRPEEHLIQLESAQQAVVDNSLPPDVYGVLPLAGTVVWNSHAFNRTEQPATMEQYLNIYAAAPPTLGAPIRIVEQLLDDGGYLRIGFHGEVPAYGTYQLCSSYALPGSATLTALSSHTHRFGVKFRIWEQTSQAGCGRVEKQTGERTPDCTVPQHAPLYTSSDYQDPIVLRFPTQASLPSSRRFVYCADYDNGSADGSPPVKRKSQSPSSNVNRLLGAVCHDLERYCIGDNRRHCGPNPSVCGNAADCDACPVRGGVTSEDEMMLLSVMYAREHLLSRSGSVPACSRPPDFVEKHESDRGYAPSAGGWNRVVTDYLAQESIDIDTVEFWGNYSTGYPFGNDLFELAVYPDADGKPGASAIHSERLWLRERRATSYGNPGSESRVYYYRAELARPVSVTEGERYWFSITNDSSVEQFVRWSWGGSTAGTCLVRSNDTEPWRSSEQCQKGHALCFSQERPLAISTLPLKGAPPSPAVPPVPEPTPPGRPETPILLF